MSFVSFFADAEIALGVKLLEVVYMIMGLLAIYTGVKNACDKENSSRIPTGIFWIILGIIIGFGRFINGMENGPVITGVLIFIMVIPAVLQKVKPGKIDKPTAEQSQRLLEKNGMKVFIPALSIGLSAIIFALFTDLGAIVGVAVGVLIGVAFLMILSKENKPVVFLKDTERLLSTVGPLSILPMLLASLGAIFTAAGVGEVIASYVEKIIPSGNLTIGIIVYCLGMVFFTMIMGNAYAAITVMTVGIGGPFVLALGADPTVVGMLALTVGFCGTLLTPMAANFNIVPVAMLDMKKRFGVIKNQMVIAVLMIIVQIAYMLLFS
ncbi:membrane protein [Lachnospiraceae bacterium KM106-2]|nr:membrane protein [Lachnospiraceae bacterium KM106-2]